MAGKRFLLHRRKGSCQESPHQNQKVDHLHKPKEKKRITGQRYKSEME
jgi:hypothetical protein